MSLERYSSKDLMRELEKRTKAGLISRDLDVLNKIADVCGVSSLSILGHSRIKEVAWARIIYTNIIRGIYPHWSLQRTATSIGRKDHTIVLHHIKRAAELYDDELEFRKLLNKAMKAVKL
jgi:chromosomal replication initiation ATPase DnaA